MNQILHSQFIDALLNGKSVTDTKDSLDRYCERWKRQVDAQYETALLMEKVLEGPEDSLERIATIQYLRALKGGETDDNRTA